MDNKNIKTWLAGGCLATLLFLSAPILAGEQGDGGDGHRGQHLAKISERISKMSERISEHIQKLQERITAHPNAPAAVKTSADKLLVDLKDALADIEKIKTALAAHDKATLQSMKGELKKDRETIKADREALREAVREAVKDKRQNHPGEHQNGPGKRTTGA
ncbi:MAG: hypothetical protein V1899_04620 [Planctomycetota bacterium]